MQPLHSVKVRAASDSANEDESPLATDRTPFRSKSTLPDSEILVTKKWSSKIEVPIGVHLCSCLCLDKQFAQLPSCDNSSTCRLGSLHSDTCHHCIFLWVGTKHFCHSPPSYLCTEGLRCSCLFLHVNAGSEGYHGGISYLVHACWSSRSACSGYCI